MPKNNKVTKVGGQLKKQKVPSKLRIGTRKGGKSANLMSKAELEAVIADTNRSKYHHKARTALAKRV